MTDIDGIVAGIIWPFDQASLDATGDTLATRWEKAVAEIAERTERTARAVEADLTDAGFRCDDLELSDLEWVGAMVAGSISRLQAASIYSDLDAFYDENRNAAMALAEPDCVGAERLACLLALTLGISGALAVIDRMPLLNYDRLEMDGDYFDAAHTIALMHIGLSHAVH